MNINDWKDENGLIHHRLNPNEDTSENEMLFTGTCIVLNYLSDIFAGVMHTNLMYFYWNEEENDKRISHDNATAIVCACKILDLHNPIPIFNKHRLHPRDIIMYGYAKYPWLFWWLLWIPSISMVISCMQTYKTRGGNKIIKADGKILAYLRFKAFNMKVTEFICTKLIKRKREHFGSWLTVFVRYYSSNYNYMPGLQHPNVLLMEELSKND